MSTAEPGRIPRAAFLRATAAGTFSSCVAAPLSARAAEPEVVEVTLAAAPFVFRPFPGVTYRGLAYNGAIPGPMIRVRHGQ